MFKEKNFKKLLKSFLKNNVDDLLIPVGIVNAAVSVLVTFVLLVSISINIVRDGMSWDYAFLVLGAVLCSPVIFFILISLCCFLLVSFIYVVHRFYILMDSMSKDNYD